MARLLLHPGTDEEVVFALPNGPALLGRADENHVTLPHVSISRRHATLEPSPQGWTLRDLGSTNGTWFTEQRIDHMRVRYGDLFRCGDLVLQLVEDVTSEPTFIQECDPTAPHLRLASTEEQIKERLQTLLEVSRILASPEPIDRLLERIVDIVMEILEVERVALLLVGPEGELEPEVVRSKDALYPGETVHSRTIVDYVRKRSMAALFADTRSDPRTDGAGSIALMDIRTAMCAPLKPKDELLGVLYVDHRTRANLYDGDDLEYLASFANQAAVAIDNARLYERIESDAIVRNNLMRFFSPTTAAALKESGGASLAAIETEVTALFCDVTDFTATASGMPPKQVVEWLNEYFTTMCDVVFRHEGTLEKYIGDAMLAVWGAPLSKHDDAKRAVRAAVELQRAIPDLNARLKNRGLPQIGIHVGLNTGKVAAGNIGSPRYVQYATIGDTTNVASRICAAAGDGEILASRSTFVRLGSGWALEPMPPVRVKGKELPLDLFRVPWRKLGKLP